MTCESASESGGIRANVFDRATRQFSVKLIRNQNPSLALRIQNIIAPKPVLAPGTSPAPMPAHRFAL